MSCSMVLSTRYCLHQHFVVCARKMRKKPHPTRIEWAISHARSARPPGRPDERGSYKCSLRPRQAAWLSRLQQQAHNWGTRGSVSRGCGPRESGVCCWCLLPLLVLRRRLPFLAFLRLVTFRAGITVLLLYCYGFSRHEIRVSLLYVLVRVARGTAW